MDTHPSICSPGELGLGHLCEDLYTAILYTHAQVKATREPERTELTLAEVRRIVDEIMGSYAKLKGKQIWCEKTPKNLGYRELLRRVFPEAAFICLYRHCLDMVHSSIEGTEFGKMEEMWNPVQAFQAWIEQTGQLLSFERDNPSRSIRLKYELLVQYPARELKRIFTWLDLEWKDELVDKIFTTPHETGPSDPKVIFTRQIHRNSLGRGAPLKDMSLSKVVLQRANDLLKELGYAEIGSERSEVSSTYLQVAGTSTVKKIDNVSEVFARYIPEQMQQHELALGSVAGIIKFFVKGNDGGVWQVDLTTRPGQILASDGRADCTLTIGASDLLKVVNGELNPAECFLQARLKVDGNVELAYKFGQVIFAA